MTSPAPDLSIVVANWNGAAWLGRCLSSLQISARATPWTWELIVVDDASTDDSATIVERQFPRARLVRSWANRGFARSVNRGARVARGRVLVLANNDLSAQEGFVGALVRWFLDPPAAAERLNGGAPLFAVSARTMGWYDGRPNQLCMAAQWRGGRITPAWLDPPSAHPCLFVQAGAAAYDRAAFLRLGGLSRMYHPGYWEDYDLSWRAAAAGWAQLYDPAAVALHVGGGSMTRRFGADGVARLKSRNHLLFELAHLDEPRLIGEWALRLPVALAREAWRGGGGPGGLASGLAAALPAVRAALRTRMRRGGGRATTRLLAIGRDFTPSF
jgi:GT2 family glycosyltransferase